MKKVFLITTILVGFIINCSAQKSTAELNAELRQLANQYHKGAETTQAGTTQGGTTQEEYNYITKGYQVQIESGLDMKKGYSFVDYGKWGNKRDGICTFKGLMRQGETKPCAIMMIHTFNENNNRYYCIPSAKSSQEIWDQLNPALNDISNSSVRSRTIIWALMLFSSQEATK